MIFLGGVRQREGGDTKAVGGGEKKTGETCDICLIKGQKKKFAQIVAVIRLHLSKKNHCLYVHFRNLSFNTF